MGFTPISLLLLRRSIAKRYVTSYLFFANNNSNLKPYSTSSPALQPNPNNASSPPPKPSNLSSRLSFVFDQIDAIERDRSQKDETLQRIRAWRESKTPKKIVPDQESEQSGALHDELRTEPGPAAGSDVAVMPKKEIELVHPWAEWIELMERLVQQNYFDHKRKDEDKMVEDLGFDMSDVVDEGFDFTRDWRTVQTACLNFGRDRFDILRSLSRHDIQVLVGYGCPSADKKVVFSAKLLRKHVHLDEGDVCSSCNLRSSCERAYLITNKEDEARTIDIMRVLLTYAFDPINGSVTNSSLLKQKSVKTVIRKLLHQIVKLSAVPIDPHLPPPVFKKPPPKVKQAPPPPKKRVGRDDIEMKKGDWLCTKCDFMNFAKNTVCLQCDAKRPKRQLLPGEWECPECNFLNYRRNTACFHCECRRPPDEYTESQMQERPRGARTRLDNVPNRQEVDGAWNFDFDDNESDGADVAAFEYADTPRMGEEFSVNAQARGGASEAPEHGFGRTPFNNEMEHSPPNRNRPGKGFDDFDDEEDDDDIDSYEVDTHNDQIRRPYNNEGFSDEDIESHGPSKPLKRVHPRTDFSGSEDDDLDIKSRKDLSVHPNWKSSHVANPKGRRGPSRGLSFGSDADDYSDDDFGSGKNKNERTGFKSNRREFKSKRRFDSDDDDSSFDSDASDDGDRRSSRSRGNMFGPGRGGGKNFKGRNLDFVEDSSYGSDDDFDQSPRGGRGGRGRGGYKGSGYGGQRRNDRSGSDDDFDRSPRGGRGAGRRGGFRGGDYGGQRRNDRTDTMRSSNGSRRGDTYGDKERGNGRNDRGEVSNRREGYGNRERGGRGRGRGGDRGDSPRSFNGSRREGTGGSKQRGKFRDDDRDQSFGDDRPRRVRIIER